MRRGQNLGESIKSVATCWHLTLTEPPLCARTPTWTDSSSSARKESWTSRYLLPPTSSTAWRSVKALHPFPVTAIETSCSRLPANPTLARLHSTRSLPFDVLFFFFVFTSTSPTSPPHPLPLLLFLTLPFSCFSRVCWAWRGSRWSSASCQCSSTSCSRSWLRMTMTRSPLPPRGRLRYCSVPKKMCFCQGGAEWILQSI